MAYSRGNIEGKTNRITVVLPEETIKNLQKKAKEEDRTVSYLIRRAVEEFLRNEEKDLPF